MDRRERKPKGTLPRGHSSDSSSAPHEGAEVIQGLRAGLAVFARRRHDILRATHSRGLRHDVAELSRWAAANGVPCIEASDIEVDGFAGSTHHEGLCVAARPRRWAPMQELAELLVRSGGTAVALDRVRNPYNVGAVLRSAAFFGLDAALLGAPSPDPGLSATAVRVAEGGAEELRMARTTDLADTLGRLRSRGIRVVGTDAGAEAIAPEGAFRRPAILVLGNEREGLADRVRAQCDSLVAIRGSGRVQSLNVAVAAGVLFASMVRR